MPLSSHGLPGLYDRWITDLLGEALPDEPRVTCDACAMCAQPGTLPLSAYTFEVDVKCCAYLPVLPNFLVGRILRKDHDDPGRQSVAARLADRVAVGPLGLHRPPTWSTVHRHTVNTQGRSRTLRCPHFVVSDGSCGIHDNRNHMCASWFCKPARGQYGQALHRSMDRWLEAIEHALARWCALELSLDPRLLAPWLQEPDGTPVDQLDGPAVDGVVSDALWAARWGALAGQEEAFYLRCADLVEDLDLAAIRALCGPEVTVRERLLSAAWAATQDDTLPERLSVGIYQTLAIGEQGTVVTAYSPLDAIVLPTLLMGVLHYFDGRPAADAFRAIEEERGLRFDAPLVRQLLDFGILRPAR